MSTQNQTCVIRQGRLAFHCPACNTPMSARIDEAGQRYTCAKCETDSVVPAPPATPRPDDPLIQGEDKIAALRRSLKEGDESESGARSAARAERSRRLERRSDSLWSWSKWLIFLAILSGLVMAGGLAGWIAAMASADETTWSASRGAFVPTTNAQMAQGAMGGSFVLAVLALSALIACLAAAALLRAVATHLDVTAEELAESI